MSEIATDSLEERVLQIIENKKPEKVSQLVALLKEQLGISEEEALDLIMDLMTRGRIEPASQPLALSFTLSSYLKTSHARWYWITTFFALLTLIVVLLVPENLQPWSYMRNILGAIFVLYVPGYTFIKTLFPVKVPIRTDEENLDKIERIVLSIGMSLAVVPIVGLLLNYSPWGIQLVPFAFSLFAFSMVFASTALIREQKAKIKTQIL